MNSLDLLRRAGKSVQYRARRIVRPLRRTMERAFYGWLVLLNRGVYDTLVSGRKVRYSVKNWADVYRARTFNGERNLVEEMAAAVRPGDTVWDVGAHAGWYTIPLAIATGSKGKVVSFEPVATLPVRCAGMLNSTTSTM